MVDLNCDMGEGMWHDADIMPWITSANIACGFHAGSTDLMRRTIDLALQNGVKIGAHPSFRDKEHFGRREMHLPADKLYALVIEQLIRLDLIAREQGALLHHIKPHGALYNMAARDAQVAKSICQAIQDFEPSLVVYGLSGSQLIAEAQRHGLSTASEAFADRTYTDNGSLTSRAHPFALIEDEDKCVEQAVRMVNEGIVISVLGTPVPILAETLCIHSDGKHAVAFAKKLYETFQSLKFAPSA